MLTDNSLEFIHTGVNGVALVWVIDTQCLYDLPLSQEHANVFLNATEVLDISSDYPDHEGITVRFLNNDEVLEELQTTEYFGSILLSNPLVLNLRDYAYGMYVESPNALFVDNRFVILDADELTLEPFRHGH